MSQLKEFKRFQKFDKQQQPQPGDVFALTKIPPQALEAEQAILASILMDNHAINACMEHLTDEDFYKEAHKIIFRAMLELNNRNEPTDLVTLNAHLENQQMLEA